MTRSTTRHLALDSGHAEISGEDIDLTTAATSYGVFKVDGFQREFTSGPIEFGHCSATQSGVQFTETFRLQDGKLDVGEAVAPIEGQEHLSHMRLGLWQGRQWSLSVFIYGRSSSADIIALFNRFVLTEALNGISMTAKDTELTPYDETPGIIKVVPMVGLLDIRPIEQAERPTQPGTRVRGGELYIEDTPGVPQRTHLIHISSTAVTKIVPIADQVRAATGQPIPEARELVREALPHVQSLIVKWSFA